MGASRPHGFAGSDRAVVELQAGQTGVKAALRHQIVMRADGDDLAVIKDHDTVGAFDGGQTVRHHDQGAALRLSLIHI